MTDSYITYLRSAIGEAATALGRDWLDKAVIDLATSQDLENDLALLLAVARRKTGETLLRDAAPIAIGPGIALEIAGWTTATASRVLLLLEAARLNPREEVSIVTAAFRMGDETERAAIMRGLVLFPSAQLLKPIALEVGRANSMELYTVLALNNPFPAEYYSDHEFNQMVLKSLFNMLPIEQVSGLARRANPDLSRMCADYIQERCDAGREVPTNIWLALAPCADAIGNRLLLKYLVDEDPRHRFFCALAMGRKKAEEPDFDAALGRQLAVETDDNVRKILASFREE